MVDRSYLVVVSLKPGPRSDSEGGLIPLLTDIQGRDGEKAQLLNICHESVRTRVWVLRSSCTFWVGREAYLQFQLWKEDAGDPQSRLVSKDCHIGELWV